MSRPHPTHAFSHALPLPSIWILSSLDQLGCKMQSEDTNLGQKRASTTSAGGVIIFGPCYYWGHILQRYFLQINAKLMLLQIHANTPLVEIPGRNFSVFYLLFLHSYRTWVLWSDETHQVDGVQINAVIHKSATIIPHQIQTWTTLQLQIPTRVTRNFHVVRHGQIIA